MAWLNIEASKPGGRQTGQTNRLLQRGIERGLKLRRLHHAAERRRDRVIGQVVISEANGRRPEPVASAIGCLKPVQRFGFGLQRLGHANRSQEVPTAPHNREISRVA